ncbi:terminase large subunit [Sinorhizobium meliloti]|uniref:terminase large subunit n=1 Tax=Rhizobium meliloti TaxID=382 RepID=UPI0020746E21|nr:terminase TerL endonuclease subunit [Sinorhizobium meliloti]MCM5691428.1 terminase large subunit [Sinorhizobium meliloti]
MTTRRSQSRPQRPANDNRQGAIAPATLVSKAFPHWINDDSAIADPFGYGERAVEFLRRLKHPKSTLPGNQFVLDPWQERVVRRIYGPRDEHGQRIVRTVFLMLPRGARKTSLSAALSLLQTIGPEHTPAGESVFAASDRTQAGIAFREAADIIRADKRLVAATKINDAFNAPKQIVLKRDNATLKTVSSDGGAQHGGTPRFVLADEVHIWKGRDLWEALRTGLSKTPGSLLVIATTAGRGQENLAFDTYDYARKVARGDIIDPSFLPIIFEPAPDADWRDEAVWHAVNPGLALGYPDIAGLRAMAREAEARPAEREAFRQYHLNCWLDHSAAPFVDMDVYDAGNEPIDLDALAGEPCWLGCDLSSSTDLSVIVAAFRRDDDYIVVPFFFCPEENLRQRQEASGAPYVRWAAEGLITATLGNVVDFRAVEAKLRDLCAEFDVREIAFDPALARVILNNLMDDGLPAIEFRQGALSMMPAIAELERAVVAKRLKHGGHPVLRFCFANCEVETNSHGHKVRLKKGKKWLSIDGTVASSMAVLRASLGDSAGSGSIYDDDGWQDALAAFG